MKVITLLNRKIWILLLLILTAGVTVVRGQKVVYVDHTATAGLNDGGTWANAYISLAKAIQAAHSDLLVDTILVAKGTYYPEYTPPSSTANLTENDKTFYILRDGMALFGGFQPGGQGGWEAREMPGANGTGTILSGDLNRNGSRDTGDAYHVLLTIGTGTTPLGSSLVLDGLTVSGGNANGYYSVVVNSTLVVGDEGGGMYNSHSNPTIVNCAFSGNYAGVGSGMYNRNSSPAISGSTFSGNSGGIGGGMCNVESSPTISGSVFSENGGQYSSGGGMYNTNSSPVISGSTFTKNKAYWGGGINSAAYSSLTLIACVFSGNEGSDGGGMINRQTTLALINCIFSGNKSNIGGGMMNSRSTLEIANCTFSGNYAVQGGDLDNYQETTIVIDNSIFWGSISSSSFLHNTDSGTPVINHSIVPGGYPGIGNLDVDPGFVNAPADSLAPFTHGDYRLKVNSPAINAGDNESVPSGITTDLDNKTRIVMDRVDMGAYEFAGEFPYTNDCGSNALYVDNTASGLNNGTSWNNAYTSLATALLHAHACTNVKTIVVAKGTYYPEYTLPISSATTTGRGKTFYFTRDQLTIYGGFQHGGVGGLEARELPGEPGTGTILSGDLNQNNTRDDGDACQVVFIAPGGEAPLGNSLRLDGLTISGGNADGVENFIFNSILLPGNIGGGMVIADGAPTLTNIVFRGNKAKEGGGVYSLESSPTISNSVFTENDAESGGGMYIYSGSPSTLTNVTFSGNTATLVGGGMTINEASATITNSIFSENTTKVYGGGLAMNFSSTNISNCTFTKNTTDFTNSVHGGGGGIFNNAASPVISNTTFTENTTAGNWGGGGILNMQSSPKITGCTFTANGSTSAGAGILNTNQSRPDVSNCVFRQNTAVDLGGGMFSHDYSYPKVTNSIFMANTAQTGGGMCNYANAFPTVINCLFSGNRAGRQGGGMFNLRCQSTVSNSTFSGNSATDGGGDIYNFQEAVVSIRNCILWGSSSSIANFNSTETVSNSIVQGGFPGTGNLDADPLFVNAPAYTSAPFVGGDYRLLPGSPAINTGDNGSVPEGVPTDLGGHPRIAEGTVDMGAYEHGYCAINTLYVDASATGLNYGIDWANALTSLADALMRANACTNVSTILVAKGTYYPENLVLSFASDMTDRDKTFYILRDKLAVYGGFQPGGVGGWEAREFGTTASEASVLSGDLNKNGVLDNGDAYHVLLTMGGGNSIPLLNTLVLDGFVITGGNADAEGGVEISSGSAYRGHGGGMYNIDSSPTVTNCIFLRNQAIVGGGMNNTYQSSPLLTNTLFTRNTASMYGAAISNFSSSSLTLINATISGNSANDTGGGLYNDLNSNAHIHNSIIRNNDNGSNGSADVFNGEGSSAQYTHSLVQGVTVNDGNGNIDGDVDPLFIDAAENDYRLQAGSPVINLGNNARIPAGITTDLAGNSRINNNTVDLGAYEAYVCNTSILYVDAAASGLNDGSSWTNALTSLAHALRLAHDCSGVNTILVARGTYYPENKPPTESVTTERDKTFYILRDNLAIYGGYPAGGGTRDHRANPTILSGDLNRNNGLDASDAYHVILAAGTSDTPLENTLILDGFIITGGNSYGVGDISINGVSVSRIVGGGMHNVNSSPSIVNCIISENRANNGGGLSNIQSSPVVLNCIISGNRASIGGGVYNYFFTTPVFTNCLISGNKADGSGGGMFNYFSSLIITNCTFSGNNALSGGDIYNAESGPEIYNSVFWGSNSTIISPGNTQPVVRYSLVEGDYEGTDNLDANPLFVNAPHYDTAPFVGGDYQLQDGSPAINTGNNDNFPGLDTDTKDLSGNPRLVGTRIDMGAYESPDGALPVTLVFFQARIQEAAVLLTWQTTSEINASHFTIERSIDTKSWESIATLAAAGNSETVMNYRFTDIAPAEGTSYYRLKMADHATDDRDTPFTYSIIRSVDFRSAVETTIRAYPNPVSTGFSLEGMSYTEIHDVEILSAAGHPLRKWTEPESGSFNVAGLTDGVYLVRVISKSGKIAMVKIVIAR